MTRASSSKLLACLKGLPPARAFKLVGFTTHHSLCVSRVVWYKHFETTGCARVSVRTVYAVAVLLGLIGAWRALQSLSPSGFACACQGVVLG